MPPKTVSLNSAGHPYIKVKVYGVSQDFAAEFDALIDTGFTGFLHLPLTLALPLGLTLLSTANYTLGDGTTCFNIIAFGTVEHEGQQIFGPISLELNTKCQDVLLGMDFIRQSKQMLILCEAGAVLLDMAEALEAVNAMNSLEGMGKPPETTPSNPP